MGGVLEVAGIDGFLGNLDEMMEASDSEGAGWSAFIATWWDRFGTADVGAADLFDVAVFCDPAPPVSGNNDRAQKTSFGIAIKKMRDRVFRIGARQVRIVKARIEHKATRWRLEVCADRPARHEAEQPQVVEPRPCKGNLQSGGSPTQATEIIGRGEPGEPREPLSSLTHTRAHAHAKGDAGKGSPGSRGSPSPANSVGYSGEPSGEPPIRGSRASPIPDWLRELDP